MLTQRPRQASGRQVGGVRDVPLEAETKGLPVTGIITEVTPGQRAGELGGGGGAGRGGGRRG